ncbi:MAG: TIGR00730 family Rossman fold protein [Nevskiaceae bacterium]|nr:MAG: TIGR00730 family Rossman fold protein [Nevskiaceae bacterium]TBR73903.1 MAG: TIGR00730 family Rossman fold protein [Nevskiaceae bacterium]
MAANLRAVCVFCASAPGVGETWAQAARAFARELLHRKLALVYGGSQQGLMGVVADTVLQGGGRVVGVMPTSLVQHEVAHQGLAKLHVVDTLAERKALMADLSDAFVALPGGYGTLDELGDMLAAQQLGLHHKPVGVLNTNGYYDSLITFLDHAVGCGFIRPPSRARLQLAADSATLLDALEHANLNAAEPGRSERSH